MPRRFSLFAHPALAAAVVCSASLVCSAARAQADDTQQGTGAVPRGAAGAAVKPAKQPAKQKKKHVIVWPKLVHFEHAPYPPEAQKEGLQADVVLKLTIDATGKVTKAEVEQPAGHGFDEAAQAAAMKFEFTPPLVDGKPHAVQIEYKYSFTLETPPPEKQPPPPPPPKVGNLGGTIQIQTGTATPPLVGAQVTVTAPDGTKQSLTTDAKGHWQLEGQKPGSYKVKVEAEGFTGVEYTEKVTAGKGTEATYRLLPKRKGLEVTVLGKRPPREVTRRTLQRREINRIPGTSGDALRSIQSLPGVARPPGFAGLLIVRGSAPQDTQTFIDGSDVPLIYHFGGLSSVVPTELLDKIDFYPGNFSARYGRVMGGIVDAGLRSPDTQCTGDYGKPLNKDGCYHGMAEVDLIDGRLLLQGPIGPLKHWSFAAAARRSWIDAWIKPVLEKSGAGVTTAPVYYDYQLIADNKPTHDSDVSFRFYGSDDRIELLIKDPAAEDPAFGGNLNFGTSFWRIQGLYKGRLSRDLELNSMLSVGRDAVDFSVGTFRFNLARYPVSMRSEFGWRMVKHAKLDVGLDFFTAPYTVSLRVPPPPRPGEPDPGPFATRPPIVRKRKGFLFRPAWYVEAELTPTRRLRIVPGARVDAAVDSGHPDFSPRVNARYDIVSPNDSEKEASEGVHKRLRTTLKGGVGIFAQPPEPQETDPVFGTPGLYSNRAIHYDLGVEQELTKQIELGVEGFYKDLSRLVERSPSGSGFAYNNLGSGYVVGLETLLKYKPDKHFFGWLAYTLSRSVRKNGPDLPEYLFQYDQTHNLTILGSYRLGRGWEFGARFRIISGSLVTPVVPPPTLPAVYAADAGSYVPIQGKPYTRRLPLFHQLDLRVDKRWQFKDWRLSAYLDVQNVYNNAAVEAITYNYNYSESSYQTGLPIIPSIGLRGEF